MKNETMKNGTAIMGKDEWDQFDKTKVTFSFKTEIGIKSDFQKKVPFEIQPKKQQLFNNNEFTLKLDR